MNKKNIILIFALLILILIIVVLFVKRDSLFFEKPLTSIEKIEILKNLDRSESNLTLQEKEDILSETKSNDDLIETTIESKLEILNSLKK